MAKDTLLKRALLSYQLASSLVELHFVAENAWCSDRFNEDRPVPIMQRLRAVAKSVEKLVDDLNESDKCTWRVSRSKKLQDLINDELYQFCELWRESARRERIQGLPDIDEPEQDFERDQYLLVASPLRGTQARAIEKQAKAYIDALAEAEKACFDVACLLCTELHPTITREGGRNRLPEQEYAYIRVDLNRRLAVMMERLVEHFPFLDGLDFDLTSATPYSATDKIARLNQKIQSFLKNPESATPPKGYLGIIADESRGYVFRKGQRIEMTGQVSWQLLNLLLRSRDSYSPQGVLMQAWGEGDFLGVEFADRDRNKIYQAIRALRSRLSELGVTIEGRRDEGYRLVAVPPKGVVD